MNCEFMVKWTTMNERARQTDLRSLLAAARARLRPRDVGLPILGHRRLPGLRREEVAELVGVSTRWYASFEAGDGSRRFSAAFVQRVADVLHLSDPERMQLFELALPEAAAVARHVHAAAGRAISSAIYRQLVAQEQLREAKEQLRFAQASAGRALATAIYFRLLEKATTKAPRSRHLTIVRKRDARPTKR
jgi:transcriptional regulator with XRE-family HTH domain